MKPFAPPPARPRSTLLAILLLWALFYPSWTLWRPALLDDADSVHAEVAREMLLRQDPVTLYANGIRYLEKAPLLYWSMAACQWIAGLPGSAGSPGSAGLLGSPGSAGSAGSRAAETMAAASRVPLALAVLGLALASEALARRMLGRTMAGLYAAVGVLSSFGVFLFTRITIPDVFVCLWITLALYAFWRTEELDSSLRRLAETPELVAGSRPRSRIRFRTRFRAWFRIWFRAWFRAWSRAWSRTGSRAWCWAFAASCALNVLSKGLIGIVFPLGIVVTYLLLTRGWRGAGLRARALHPLSALVVFLAIAAPWHMAAGLANPGHGHPEALRWVGGHWLGGHWLVPLPTDGNVRGWFWFYFLNEHLLRYLNLRVPHDYDTAPLWLFWGLCLVWLMPWSAFLFKAVGWAVPVRSPTWRSQLARHDLPFAQRGRLLLAVWAAVVLLFFSLSTRQEYYVLPALPALLILVAGWLTQCSFTPPDGEDQAHTAPGHEPRGWRGKGPLPASTQRASTQRASTQQEACRRSYLRCVSVLVLLGGLFALACVVFLVHTRAPSPNADLAGLLRQNPGDYALSMGHFLDLNGAALGLFRLPLLLAAVSLFAGPLAALLLRRRKRDFLANAALAAGAFGFLLASHLGLQTFAPVLSSAQLAEAVAPQVRPGDLVVLHGEYEAGSTLGFYLKRSDLHILEGRSSNLWYGSFFPDAPPLFETPATLAARWAGPQRVFLWQSLTDEPRTLPPVPGPVYVIAQGGGKEIVSNQPNR